MSITSRLGHLISGVRASELFLHHVDQQCLRYLLFLNVKYCLVPQCPVFSIWPLTVKTKNFCCQYTFYLFDKFVELVYSKVIILKIILKTVS